ncbi:carboxypeptidase-like regulatory domain-containing protein [Flavobacterium branchiophilum]|uniref:carboxypeptidase-like regulatory domain-containing protein n=2 Tax=Flavobacterium branchiophilum TaxID=55197 RepID=UPI00163B59CB|nr:carboxypeptidase-like regulatory domain-containing protein [Flavobacterium branchiophilum]
MKKNRISKQIYFCLITLLLGNFLFAQATILGIVNDSLNNPISFANIYIKPYGNNSIIGFTSTDKEGKYKLITNKIGDIDIFFSALSYKTVKNKITINNNKNYTQNAVLKHEIVSLDEVILQKESPITIKQDTIIIDAKAFSKGNETVVEDLLRKIPGLTVTANGTIKIGGKEVSKVMVGGDDFFEYGYKLLTKNMNANVVDNVEIYQKYSNNRLLKGVENSDKVALNLTLKKNIKAQWFGNLSMGYGVVSENRYEVRTNLMSFGKKAKHYFIGNLNNIGIDAIGEVDDLIKPFNPDDIDCIGDGQNANKIINLNAINPNLKSQKINFNNAELASFNSIYTITPKIKLKTLVFLNSDENDFFRNSYQFYSINNDSFSNSENFHLSKKKIINFGKINVTNNISKTKMLEISSSFNNTINTTNTNLLFNNNLSKEDLNESNQRFDEKIVYSNKFKEHKILIFSSRYINEKTPQKYQTDIFNFPELFQNINNVTLTTQQSENKMDFFGLDAHLLDRKSNGNLFELKSGYEFRKDILTSTLILKSSYLHKKYIY